MDGQIIHGNADLVPPEGAHALAEAPVDLFPELDDLLDADLLVASHRYRHRLQFLTPKPVAPVPLT